MANVNEPNSRPSSVLVPVNYPMEPQPGKISLLFSANSQNLYHKYNPNDYDGSTFGFTQPYIYKEIGSKSIGRRGLPLSIGVDDIVRISKFVASGRGLLFLGKQFLLQGQATYDECNIYNPSEVILSTVVNLSGGLLDKPKRHIDKSGGLLGGLASLVGIGISRNSPPPSTVAAGNGQGGSTEGSLFGGISLLGSSTNRETEVLSVRNYGEGSGLLRARTALKGKSILEARWGVAANGGSGILSYIKGIAKSIIPQVFGSDKQNFKQRADEGTYGLMVKFYNDFTAKELSANNKLSISFMGINLKGGNGLPVRQKTEFDEKYKQKYYKDVDGKTVVYNDDFNKAVPVTPEDDAYEEKSSIVLKQNELKLAENRRGVINKDTVAKTNTNLQNVIKNIGKSKVYKTNFSNKDNLLLSSGQPTKNGYDRLYDMNKYTGRSIDGHENSIAMLYVDESVRTLDNIINGKKNFGFSGNGRPDKINTLTVLDKDKKTEEYNDNGNWTKWEPYEDDLIAFFFYDVVNDKYIPFRATVKGISESNNALWDELRFIGRADALYSYSGFTRNLSFTFTVVINSLLELLPVWKRINYLASSVKPAEYTKIKQNNITNSFIIPPMFMVTIGDLYKYQPIVITTVTVNIPENAVWETVSENSTEEWSFLSKIIKTTVSKGKIAQVPREIEVSIACNVLEKERPVVGGNHFGHSPVDENGIQLFDSNVEYLPQRKAFSQNLRIDPLNYKMPSQALNTQFQGSGLQRPAEQPFTDTIVP